MSNHRRHRFDIDTEELGADCPRAPQPRDTKVRLWPHQLALLHRCQQFEQEKIPLKSFQALANTNRLSDDDFMRTQVGIIGDHVGSGKSYVILALILTNDISSNASTIKTYGNNRVVMCFAEHTTVIKTNLIVVPHNLVNQWQTYISNYTDKLKVLTVSKERHIDKLRERAIDLRNYDVVLVTATFYAKLAQFVVSRSYKVQRIVFDEIDSLNLPNCMCIDSNFYWFVTASYGNLLCPRGYSYRNPFSSGIVCYAEGLRNTGFVKELFVDLSANLSLDFVKALVVKNSSEFVKTSTLLPEIRNHFVRCLTPRPIHTLNGFVSDEVIQSLNAGDVATAIRLISPTHVSTEENIISIQIDKLAKELFNAEARITFTASLEFEDPSQRDHELGRLERRRDELKRRMEGIRNRIKESDMCSICFDNLDNKSITPCCSNAYCLKCISTWLSVNTMCPLCKARLAPKDLLIVAALERNSEAASSVSDRRDKIDNLKVILQEKMANGAKVIIYSAYETTFDRVSELLRELGMSYSYLKGNEGHVTKTLQRYKDGDLSVLLANTRHYGSGINLENTSDIIMFHKIDSEMEKQVIGRAQRYGRTCALNVWYLLYDNEYDSVMAASST